MENPASDLTVDLPHDVSDLKFTDWVYGAADSPRIAIAVGQTRQGDYALYVDRSRDRSLGEGDLVKGAGELRKVPLPAQQIVDFVVHEYPRQVLFRWRSGESHLSVATATRIEHTIRPDGEQTAQPLKTCQIDGNANGLFADTKDLLQVDLNDDGRFDPFLETFPLRPLMKLRGQRWFARADPFGKRLRLEAATATGRVRVAASAHSKRARITELILTLSGEDGSVYSLSGAEAETELPVGRYAASVLYMAVRSEETGQSWEFTFSREGGGRAGDWLQVGEDETVEFDPIGDLALDAVVEPHGKDEQTLDVQPRLLTGSGLLINLCRVDSVTSWQGPQCHLSLKGPGGQALDQSNSGFS